MAGLRGPRTNPQNSTPQECRGCHRIVRGNGGVASHSKVCVPLAELLLAENERLLAKVDSGTYFATGPRSRMSENARREFRAQIVRSIGRLQARLKDREAGHV